MLHTSGFGTNGELTPNLPGQQFLKGFSAPPSHGLLIPATQRTNETSVIILNAYSRDKYTKI